jgi:hypothetical protein
MNECPYHKTYYGCNLQISIINYSVCPWQAFPARLVFAGKAPLTLPTNTRQGWKGLPVTNILLAYYRNP